MLSPNSGHDPKELQQLTKYLLRWAFMSAQEIREHFLSHGHEDPSILSWKYLQNFVFSQEILIVTQTKVLNKNLCVNFLAFLVKK